jgi:hypothetical protein
MDYGFEVELKYKLPTTMIGIIIVLIITNIYYYLSIQYLAKVTQRIFIKENR